MKIGALKNRIVIEARSETKDSFGQKSVTWSELATVWANVRPIGGRERLAALTFESAITHTVAVRYNSEFLPVLAADAFRITFDNRTLMVQAARDLEEAHRFIVFDCLEGRAS